ncbi:TPA: DUF2290 domain-containing protein [Streptococcus suis]
MAQKLSKFIQKEIVDFTTCLIEIGLETGNNYPKSTTSSGVTYISPAVEDSNHKIIFDTQLEYADFYKKLDEKTNYNVKLVDGSLVSLIYEIDDKDNHILTHRLTFFPSPSLFANEIYEEAGLIDGYEELYSDIISKNIYPFPIRFDFDLDNSVDIEHPKSHLTLGQYKNCRIPVSSALTPGQFLIFIIRNFYSAYYKQYREKLHSNCKCPEIEESITANEKTIPHFIVK